MKRLTRQCGFSLLELILVLAIGSTVLAVTANRQVENALQSKAAQAGGLVAQYNAAVASYIRDNGSTTPANTYTGTAWLKDRTNCPGGTASVQYLPCGFPNALPFNQRPSTMLTNTAGKVNATTTFGPLPVQARGGYRGDIANEVAATALAKLQNIIGTQTFSLNKNHLITATVSTAGNNPSAFLRVDGSNAMLADLNVGGNNIDSANTVNATTLRANTLQDANHTGFFVDPGGTSHLNDVRASIIYDRDDTAYYINPASASMMNEVRASYIYDRDNTAYYVDPASTSSLNSLYTDTIHTNILYDRQNAAYYIDPASTTKLNITDTQHLQVATRQENTACQNSNIAVDGQGKLLTCQGNLWKKGVSGIRISGSFTCNLRGRGSARKRCMIGAAATHDVCYLTHTRAYDGDDIDGFSCSITRGGSSWYIDNWGQDFDVVDCRAECLTFGSSFIAPPPARPPSCPAGQRAISTGATVNGQPGYRCIKPFGGFNSRF